MNAEIRPVTAQDIPALVPLVEQYWLFEDIPHFDGARVRRTRRPSSGMYKASAVVGDALADGGVYRNIENAQGVAVVRVVAVGQVRRGARRGADGGHFAHWRNSSFTISHFSVPGTWWRKTMTPSAYLLPTLMTRRTYSGVESPIRLCRLA